MGNGLTLPSLLRQPDATDSTPQQHAPDLPAGHSPPRAPTTSTLPRLFRPFIPAPDPPTNMSGKRASPNAATRGDAIFNSARGALAASTPENYTAPDPSTPPAHTLRVRRAAGYRIHDARHNLFFTGPHTAVFPAAAVGIVQDLRSPAQRFCSAHDDDVVALTYHKGAGLVATGQVGVSPAVHVWHAAEPENVVASFVMPKGSKAVAAVAFSHDARYLVVAAADNDHTLCVFDVQGKPEPVATTKGGSSAIVDLACAPSASEDRVFEFVAVGQKSVRFWAATKASIGPGLALNSKNGVFGGITGSNDPEPVNSVVYLPAQQLFATGTQSGHVITWSPAESKAVQLLPRVHNAQVFALAVADNGCLVSGSKDGLVQIWTPNLDPATAPLSFPSGVRAIDADATASTLLVGLEDGTVATTASHGRITVHVAGHKCANDAEVWALATRGDLAVTAGDDAQLLVWDVPSGTVRARAELPAGGARAVAIHPSADIVAVGLNSGAIQHRRLSQPEQVVAADVSVSSKRITTLAFSPDGSKLAVGAADSNITLLTNGQVTATITAHSAAVTALDWSTDSTYIQSNSADYELLFTRVQPDGTASHDPDASNVRSLDWASYSIPIGWATRGVWTPGQDGTDINAVARGNGPGLIAVATDKGHVEVVNWPAPTAGHVTARHVGRVHAAHVTNVRWANGDRTAVSTGGRDGCVVFWDVVPVA
ncbi:Echinoderm microtubule-associated protein-like 6 [Allomyces javanicus]|nr:Echinoderm microtubule-associated protein-like 6 [Allomyces javanicus]